MPNYVRQYFHPDRYMSTGEAERVYNVRFEPCPFCHNPYPCIYMGPRTHVTCLNCGATGPESDIRGPDGLINAVLFWNNRNLPRGINRIG